MCDDEKSQSDSEVKEAQVDYNRRYTYSDYVKWDDEERWELIDGVPYLMSAPGRRHQKMLGNLYLQFGNFLKGKKCEVYFAPFAVRLNADTLDDTVVQPDLVVICDHEKLDTTGCAGAPDLAVEVLSPSTSRHDRVIKFDKYLEAGIREYWIIDPETKTLAANILNNGKYITHLYTGKDKAPVHILEGFSVDLSEVFEE